MNSSATEQEIAAEAYRLWEQDGKPNGRDQEYWFRAQESLSKKVPSVTSRAGSARAAIPAVQATQPQAPASGNGAKRTKVPAKKSAQV